MALATHDVAPYWDVPGRTKYPRIDRSHTVDVVVVGAGVTGATTAYLLQRAGLKVAILDRHRAGGADTGHTTAHLTYVTDRRLKAVVDDLGEERALAFWEAGRAALQAIEDIVRREQIECDFIRVPGYLHDPVFGAPVEGDLQLQEEGELAIKLGFAASFVDRVPFVDRPGVRFEEQARIHPLQYVDGLLERVSTRGGLVFEQSAVTEISADSNDRLSVVAEGVPLNCSDVVIATHNPIAGSSGMVSATFLQTKLALYTSYVLAARVPKGTVPDALFWDTADPYRFLRIQPEADSDVIVYGGQDHKTGQQDDTERCYAALEAELVKLAPASRVFARWSGQVIMSPDGLPLIGYTAPHQFAATAYNGNGITFATVAALVARDALTGKESPWQELFDIRRGVRGGLWDYVKENVDFPFYLVRDWLAAPEGRSLQDLPRGTGRILDLDGKRVAAFRDDDGQVSLKSAVCTHLGCVVGWNSAERTWDCPCHGSRFSATGDVIAGPAESPLADVSDEVRRKALAR